MAKSLEEETAAWVAYTNAKYELQIPAQIQGLAAKAFASFFQRYINLRVGQKGVGTEAKEK
jgi:hypothetical protein